MVHFVIIDDLAANPDRILLKFDFFWHLSLTEVFSMIGWINTSVSDGYPVLLVHETPTSEVNFFPAVYVM